MTEGSRKVKVNHVPILRGLKNLLKCPSSNIFWVIFQWVFFLLPSSTDRLLFASAVKAKLDAYESLSAVSAAWQHSAMFQVLSARRGDDIFAVCIHRGWSITSSGSPPQYAPWPPNSLLETGVSNDDGRRVDQCIPTLVAPSS
mmetsp:Transcript_9883/g.28410  ORF Transcript_9883/g.28410 Transcript_9883/m.28410 type:complete len:143 (-) Transcript_9883:259-687(-)